MSDQPATSCYGHTVPPFEAVFPRVFKAGVTAMTVAQIDQVAGALEGRERRCVGGYLGAAGTSAVLDGLPGDKQERLAAHYGAPEAGADPGADAFAFVYPKLLAATNNTLSPAQLEAVLGSLSAEEIASQSLFLGDGGRAEALSAMQPDRVQRILDHTPDWVLLETGRRAARALTQYTATLRKRERLGGKLQKEEVIDLKVRHRPGGDCVYMKWLAGPHKGRELIVNPELLGPDRVRVREGGLLGVLPVTIDVDSAVARHGSKHLVTEVGLRKLIELIERDYLKGAPAGEIRRRNHGLSELDGCRIYRMESIMPRERSRGFYCYRMMSYTDYVRALAVKVEVYGFDDELDEIIYYQGVDTQARLSDADFDPQNRSYRLR